MALLDQIIAAAIAGVAAGQPRARPILTLNLAALACALLAGGLLLVALTAALAARWGLPIAALLMAALLLGVALLLVLLALLLRRAPPPPPRAADPLLDTLLGLASLVGRTGKSSPMLLALALLGGVAASLSPTLRQALAKFVRQDFTAEK